MFEVVAAEPYNPKREEGGKHGIDHYQFGEEFTHLDNCLQALNIRSLSFQ